MDPSRRTAPPRRSAVPRIPAAVACLALAVTPVAAPPPASADHAVLHDEPQGPAAAHFPADFPELIDHEWGFRIGGFGGIERGHPISPARR
jgi:hypothetical protein